MSSWSVLCCKELFVITLMSVALFVVTLAVVLPQLSIGRGGGNGAGGRSAAGAAAGFMGAMVALM